MHMRQQKYFMCCLENSQFLQAKIWMDLQALKQQDFLQTSLPGKIVGRSIQTLAGMHGVSSRISDRSACTETPRLHPGNSKEENLSRTLEMGASFLGPQIAPDWRQAELSSLKLVLQTLALVHGLGQEVRR